MKLNLFGKKNTKPVSAPAVVPEVVAVPQIRTQPTLTRSVLRRVWVSEKGTHLNTSGQYVFEVTSGATKTEIAKQVARRYNVQVRAVRVMNMPEKRRDVGKFPGFRSGYRKAIVALESGYSIEDVKP